MGGRRCLLPLAALWLCVPHGRCGGGGVGAGSNKQCNATYYVSHYYQASSANGQSHGSLDSNGLNDMKERISDLEAKYFSLNAKYSSLEARFNDSLERCCEQSGKGHSTVRDIVHNVTKPDGSPPADCTEIFNMGYRCTGVYWIKPKLSSKPFKVLCELSYEGWTVLMRRYDGSENFYRKWSDYKNGFGSPSKEFWLGNDKMHELTNQTNYQLRVDITYWSNGYSYYTDYQQFKVDSEALKYKLHVTGYSGTSGYDGLTYHNNMAFSTWDRDNDTWDKHCAQVYKGGWWHGACHRSQLTGLYASPCVSNSCMEWNRQPLRAAVIKVKPIHPASRQ